MATLHLVRTPGGFKAADDATVEYMRRMAQGEVVSVTYKKQRNAKFHAKFMALVRRVYECTDAWPSEKALLVALKFHAGHVDTFRLADGRMVEVPRSISFAEMDDTSFHQFYERGLDALCELAGGIESDALREAVLQELSQ